MSILYVACEVKVSQQLAVEESNKPAMEYGKYLEKSFLPKSSNRLQQLLYAARAAIDQWCYNGQKNRDSLTLSVTRHTHL